MVKRFIGLQFIICKIMPFTSEVFKLESESDLGFIQFSSVQSLSRVRLCDPMNHSTPGLPVHHQIPEFTQIHVHRLGDAIQGTTKYTLCDL